MDPLREHSQKEQPRNVESTATPKKKKRMHKENLSYELINRLEMNNVTKALVALWSF